MKSRLIFTILFLFTTVIFSQENYKYTIGRSWNGTTEVYSIINQKGDTISKLNAEKYYVSLQIGFNEFAVFGIKGKKGWSAIDINKNYLFQVYNRLPGEPLPDNLAENRIRIVGKNNKIGFANSNGEIVIKPKFQYASQFDNGFAIIKSDCKKIKTGENDKSTHSGYRIECKNVGYIDKKGNIIKLGNFTSEKIKEEIKWSGKY